MKNNNRLNQYIRTIFGGFAGIVIMVVYIGFYLFITGATIAASIGVYKFVTNGFHKDKSTETTQSNSFGMYRSTQDFFEADFVYGPPQRSEGQQQNVDGLTSQNTVYQSSKDDANENTIIVAKFSNTTVTYEDLTQEQLKNALDQIQSNIISQLKTKAVSSEYGLLDSKTTLITKLEGNQVIRIVPKGQRAYIIYTNATDTKNSQKFVDSFKTF